MKRDRYREINWQEIVYYDETSRTGLRWKVSPSYKCKPGDEAVEKLLRLIRENGDDPEYAS
jgi:hypothetical protein